MERGHTSSALQNPIESGTFDAMPPCKCGLIAFPFNRGAEKDNEIIVFEN